MAQDQSSSVIVQEPHRYSAAARRIEEHIRDGGIAAGSRILGERELAKLLGVSRVTLRRALGELKDRGILVSDESKGWFVAPPKVGEQNVLRSFTEMAAALGLTAASQVMSKEIRLANREEAEARLRELPAWTLEGNAIRRQFVLRDFPQAVDFVTRLVPGAEAADHHPDVLINYKRVTLTYSTHSEGGLTAKDFDGARMADRVFASTQ